MLLCTKTYKGVEDYLLTRYVTNLTDLNLIVKQNVTNLEKY